MSSKSASTLLYVVKSHNASDVMEFTAQKKGLDRDKAHNFKFKADEGKERRPPSSVIVVDSKMTPLEAATLLWENNVMGAPVYDAKAKTYVGMFDARDILSCVTAAHREFLLMGGHHNPGEDTSRPLDVELHHKTQIELMAKALQHIKIDTKPPAPGAVTVPYLAARNPMVTFFTKHGSLLEICQVLTDRHKHRVPITDSSSGTPVCTGMISQSGLVAFIASKCPPGSMDEKMTDAGLPFRKDVVKVADDESAATAFELLDSTRLSGIAVVDEDGKLIGNTSARDIKNAVMDAGRTGMDMNILSYLAKVRQSQVVKNDKYPSCHVHDDATVGHVVNLLAKTGFHRVFVVDDDMKPVGVVSVADIIKFFTKKGMVTNGA
mmetsp:Transcript_30582/g.56524  ORF Transcript_30582/g.56524 Transcript_30582/m.56524 type:complete len:378 (-) Transcript_30582:221-1354(-)|eukprot:CAMPEP_0202023260 /NCGR_PEP_ID=MMETSP0905-20130828/51463_1 /ASSEMBLY_ACC=CAM_ASM_000554 /TAXON_ID=420261 /ORGANISM="Thalassiosira antarctica, Strain CCMP982" /LENGTH=377 /DNA_ID=CAMNT_0048585607 /DNA_START=178 /DNA_END=1311 /DNA_ORIENTATION=-